MRLALQIYLKAAKLKRQIKNKGEIVKLVKTANGNEIKLSKSEWESIGKTAGWMKEANDINALFDQYQSVRPEKPVYVSIYETSRAYGGPEEGGWWYTESHLQNSKKFYDREEAEKFAEALENGIEAQGANDEDLGSSRGMDTYPDPSGGDPMYDHSDNDIPLGFDGLARNYRVMIEERAGENATEGRPHYEQEIL